MSTIFPTQPLAFATPGLHAEEAHWSGPSVSASPSPQQPADLVIERAGASRFVYTKLDPRTGEELWRWPRREVENANRAVGQLVDVSA